MITIFDEHMWSFQYEIWELFLMILYRRITTVRDEDAKMSYEPSLVVACEILLPLQYKSCKSATIEYNIVV